MIFYFSATGNTKHAAKVIADRNGDRLISIAEAMRTGNCSYQAGPGEDIGIITPVYFWGIPDVVHRFLKTVQLSGQGTDRYVYCVLTYGTVTGGASSMIMTDLKENFGLTILAVFAARTVDTYLPIFSVADAAKNEKVLKQYDKDLEEIAGKVAERTVGDYNYDRGAWALCWPIAQLVYDHVRKTKKFSVSPDCIGCGLCERQCPDRVIRLQDGKPVWTKERCSLCLGCVNRCPKNAISFGGKTEGKGQYQNPEEKPDLS